MSLESWIVAPYCTDINQIFSIQSLPERWKLAWKLSKKEGFQSEELAFFFKVKTYLFSAFFHSASYQVIEFYIFSKTSNNSDLA